MCRSFDILFRLRNIDKFRHPFSKFRTGALTWCRGGGRRCNMAEYAAEWLGCGLCEKREKRHHCGSRCAHDGKEGHVGTQQVECASTFAGGTFLQRAKYPLRHPSFLRLRSNTALPPRLLAPADQTRKPHSPTPRWDRWSLQEREENDLKKTTGRREREK
jgi:hypothetical protein